MTHGFWSQLNKPFFMLAPMADVTDTAFRQVIAKHGKPDVFVTPFISCDGLDSEGQVSLLKQLRFNKIEHPIVMQVFGATPKHFTHVAQLAMELGFDGIDINTGCPDRAVLKQGAGGVLIKQHELFKKIVHSTKKGAGNFPVSVKTRIGFSSMNEWEPWLRTILDTEPAALVIHARTVKEMSKVPPHWDAVKRAVEIRNQNADYLKHNTLIIGNGDLIDLADAREKIDQTGADGMMLGRSIFGNPWLFSETVYKKNLTHQEILQTMLEHAKIFDKELKTIKNFQVMRKHFKAYISGFLQAKDLRIKLMQTNSVSDVEDVIQWYEKEILAK